MHGPEHGINETEQKLTSDVRRTNDVKPPREIGKPEEKHADAPKEIGAQDTNGIPNEIKAADQHPDGESTTVMKAERFDDRKEIIPNKAAGLEREHQVEDELKTIYPEAEGYVILSEQYLRDENGNIVKDSVTEEARRVDFIVLEQNGCVVDSIEVTSQTADKAEQTAKETRIREEGGNYVRGQDGQLCRIPDDLQTRIERRD